MLLSNKVYDILKYVAQIVLPALAVFWYAIAEAWGLPYVKEIQLTIIAIDTFLGALLGLSSMQYNNLPEDDEEYDESDEL